MDAKADLLVYGMGEKHIVEIARRIEKGEGVKNFDNIRGTVIVKKTLECLKNYIETPSFEEIEKNKDKFNEAFRLF